MLFLSESVRRGRVEKERQKKREKPVSVRKR